MLVLQVLWELDTTDFRKQIPREIQNTKCLRVNFQCSHIYNYRAFSTSQAAFKTHADSSKRSHIVYN